MLSHFPSGNFLAVSAKNRRASATSRRDQCSPNLCLVSQLSRPSSVDPSEPRNREFCGFLTAQPRAPRAPAQAGIRNSQGHLDNVITTAGASRAREGSASHHGRSQLGKRWRALGTSRVSRHTRHIPRKIHAPVRYLVCSSLGPAGLRGTASDGSLLLGAILEGAHRQAGRLLWCWRPRWVHVSRARRHLGDVGAALSISVVPAARRHPTPQPLIRRRPAPVSGHSAELRKS